MSASLKYSSKAIATALYFLAPTLPLYTPARARVFRAFKWALIITAYILWLIPSTAPWMGLLTILLSTALIDDLIRRSIRRKLPVEQWPKELYL